MSRVQAGLMVVALICLSSVAVIGIGLSVSSKPKQSKPIVSLVSPNIIERLPGGQDPAIFYTDAKIVWVKTHIPDVVQLAGGVVVQSGADTERVVDAVQIGNTTYRVVRELFTTRKNPGETVRCGVHLTADRSAISEVYSCTDTW